MQPGIRRLATELQDCRAERQRLRLVVATLGRTLIELACGLDTGIETTRPSTCSVFCSQVRGAVRLSVRTNRRRHDEIVDSLGKLVTGEPAGVARSPAQARRVVPRRRADRMSAGCLTEATQGQTAPELFAISLERSYCISEHGAGKHDRPFARHHDVSADNACGRVSRVSRASLRQPRRPAPPAPAPPHQTM